MWVPSKVIEWFQISKDSVDHLREDLASVRSERDQLKAQLASTTANFDWLRIKVNAMEVERAQLLEKAYGIRTIVPEIARQPSIPIDFTTDLFEDIGDDKAKKLGFPVYSQQ